MRHIDHVRFLLDEIHYEVKRAYEKHPPMASAHEGLAVIREEYLELEHEVFEQVSSVEAMRAEAIQIAAMALRFVDDVCDKAEPKEPR